MPNLVLGVLMLRLVSFAKPYKGKTACGRRDLGLKCSTSLYCTGGAVVLIKESGPYSCSTSISAKANYGLKRYSDYQTVVRVSVIQRAGNGFVHLVDRFDSAAQQVQSAVLEDDVIVG